MPFQVTTITINPNTTKFYVHHVSESAVRITIAGENPSLAIVRGAGLRRASDGGLEIDPAVPAIDWQLTPP